MDRDPSELEWNPRVVGWTLGLLLALVATLALPFWVPALRLTASDGGFGLLAPLLLLFLLPLEWILVATVASAWGLSGLAVSRSSGARTVRAYGGTRWTVGLKNGSAALPNLFISVRFAMDYAGDTVHSVPKWIGFLRPGAAVEIGWDLIFRRRGVAVVSRLIAETVLPGSLVQRRKVFEIDHRVDVLPLLYDLAPGVSELLTGRRYSPSSRVHLVPAGAEEFVGVRQYRPGDNPRFVNYALSLRMPDFPNDLVVREFEDPGEEHVCVILDGVVPSFGPDPTEFAYRFEKAISFVGSLARRFAERKHRVRVVTYDARAGKIDLTIGTRRDDLHALDLALARLDSTESLDDFYRVVRQALSGTRAPAIFVSLRDNVTVAPSGRAAVVLGPQSMDRFIERMATGDH